MNCHYMLRVFFDWIKENGPMLNTVSVTEGDEGAVAARGSVAPVANVRPAAPPFPTRSI